MLILLATGWMIVPRLGWSYGIYYPVVGVAFGLLCTLTGHVKKGANHKVEANLDRVCAEMSNQDRNLSLAVRSEGDKHDDVQWYVDVTLREISVDDYDIEEQAFATAVPASAYDIPVATATPVAVPVATAVAAATEPTSAPSEPATAPANNPLVGAPAPK